MASLVIQVNPRHGRLTDYTRTDSDRVRIGRGMTNDVILSDPYIAPDQVQLEREGEQWQLLVLDRTNPIVLNGEAVTADKVPVNSGDIITLGRTRIVIYAEDHPLEATRKLVLTSWMSRGVTRWLLPVLILMTVSSLLAFNEYQGLATALEWGKLASTSLIAVFAIVCWAGIWALTGRLLRHQPQFLIQLLVSGLVAIILLLGSPFSEYVAYAVDSETLGYAVDMIFLYLVFTALLKFNLTHATNLRKTTSTALIVNACLFLFVFGVYNFNKKDFTPYPDYPRLIKPPFARISRSHAIDEYLHEYSRQFSEVDEQRVD